MGNILGSEKPLKDVIRENQRLIKKSIRELEKEITNMERNQKKLESDIKKHAKLNQMGAVKVMVKDYVRTKNYITKFIEMKTHLNAVNLKMQTVKSHEAMAQAMKGVTKALTKLNKKVNMPGLQKIMTEFMKENEKSEITQEMIGDAIDDALEEDGTAAEEDALMGQVLDELGVSMGEGISNAPTAAVGNKTETANPVADSGMSDLEARLNNLRQA